MTKIDIVSGFLGAGKTTLIKKLLGEAFGSLVDEQKEMLADYFERHPFQKHFWLTESNHLFYEECDLLSAFREPTSIKYAKILREWVK